MVGNHKLGHTTIPLFNHFEDTSLEPEAIKDRQCISQNKNNKKALVGTTLSGK
jgi:hypothetical protein